MTDVMLTTVDNPYDPFEEFSKWFTWDTTQGYNTSGLVARLARTTDEFGDSKQEKMIEDAIDEFLSLVGTDVYTKVYANVQSSQDAQDSTSDSDQIDNLA